MDLLEPCEPRVSPLETNFQRILITQFIFLQEDAARVCGRGWQQYIKWREPASAEANRRAKSTSPPDRTHPFLVDETMEAANELARQIKNYTPKGVSIHPN